MRSGLHAKAIGDAVVTETFVAEIVPIFIARTNQLRQILVARHQHDFASFGTGTHWQRADDVVGLVFAADKEAIPSASHTRWHCRNCRFRSSGAGSRLAL